jgi:hydrogenase maturation protein HypF
LPEQGVRHTYDLRGVVQGVGFRPALYRLACDAALGGWVQNRAGVVRLVLEGPETGVTAFMAALPSRLPPNARLEAVTCVSAEPLTEPASLPFRIVESVGPDDADVVIPADLRLCADCAREVFDPADRRYGYPFTTCTQCGPRYTVVTAMPYDRERTTLAAFPLCPVCRAEYEDPADRRFHAESMACPVCGPQVTFEDSARSAETGPRRMGTSAPHGRNPHVGTTSSSPCSPPGLGPPTCLVGVAAIPAARAALAAGRIVAVRGLGGFLLAADAFNRVTLQRLRECKGRPHKPFAVMARDLETVRRFCRTPPAAAALLESPAAPIVILDLLPDAIGAGRLPADLLTPDARTLGVMLPTTPLHRLLAEPLAGDPTPAFDLLVMTSGNRRGEPIALGNTEARERLAGIADAWLTHDREITLRNDDSVCALQGERPQVWRRARGYAPAPVTLAWPLRRPVLAMGADMKNAVALGYDNRVVLSPHVGDLDTPEALEGFETVARALPEFLGRPPAAVAVDAHPDMQSAAFGRRIARLRGLPLVEVQHHHAHAAACLAEHGCRAGLALVMDGTGWGDDGTVWGAELLVVDEAGFRRLATFAPVPLPGGDAAIREPARQLVARWAESGIPLSPERLAALGIGETEANVWALQAQRGVNAPRSRAAGRLFDSVAVALGVAPRVMTYEGQPAIRLEAAARACRETRLPEVPFDLHEEQGLLTVDWAPAFRALAADPKARDRAPVWALAFHAALAKAALQMIDLNRHYSEDPKIALSGGVFMNRVLNDLLVADLEAAGLEVLRHRCTPPGDGCIALGQAVVAGGGRP